MSSFKDVIQKAREPENQIAVKPDDQKTGTQEKRNSSKPENQKTSLARKPANQQSGKPESVLNGEPDEQQTSNLENQKAGKPVIREEEVNLSIKVPKRLRRHWSSEAKRLDTTLTAAITEALIARFGEPDE